MTSQHLLCAFCWQSVRAAAELKQTHYPSILWKFVQKLRKLQTSKQVRSITWMLIAAFLGEQHLDIGKPMMNGECHASAAQLPSLYTASRLRHLTTETLLRHTAIPWHAALLQRIGV